MTERDTKPPGLKHSNTPMTPERKEVFLKALAETGSSTHAAAVASPESFGHRPGYSSFRDERRRDPQFALRWQEAMDAFLGAVEAELAKWSMKGRSRPIVNKDGQVVAYDDHPPDPRIMLAVARRHDPRWNEKQTLEHTGQVGHSVTGGLVMGAITAEHMMLLDDPEERSTFARLLKKMLDAHDQQTKVIEHQPDD